VWLRGKEGAGRVAFCLRQKHIGSPANKNNQKKKNLREGLPGILVPQSTHKTENSEGPLTSFGSGNGWSPNSKVGSSKRTIEL
jgi:hypothetical protein